MKSQGDVPGARAQLAGLVFALLLVDPDTVIAEANPASEELLGRSAHRLIGSGLFDILEIDDPRVTDRAQNQDAPLVARWVRVRTGGVEGRINLTISPLASHPGWRVVTLSDAGQETAGETDRSAAGISAPAVLAHEIKNPLAAIRGAGQLIARKLEPEDRQLADLIETEVSRVASLLDRMQRIGTRTVEPNDSINPHKAVRRAIGTIRAGGLRDIELIEEFDPSIPPALANRGALEQVVINLLANARDALEQAGGGQIKVRTRYVSGVILNAVRLPIELTITDTGPGIDAALRENIFEPFVSTKKGGQGLGLALVQRLVRDMGGRISYERDEKQGLTHFRVHLPQST
ncbi:two-component system sensor histidine kinase NtrB [Tsuneonella deserti]|uniref:two-component system sensor histidine kinase NtrB n=1 Tax=Tsuneonella deserti TaxID=2035528 RepID=UPI001666B646|nr:ATP-binding protein [Tsuneonella deserti]